MKVFLLLLCLGGGPSVFGASIEAGKVKKEADNSSLQDVGKSLQTEQVTLTPSEQAMLEEIVDQAIAQEELARIRRSGLLKKKASNRISSLEHYPIEEYGPPPEPVSYHTKSFSLWTFKKAILNALVQAIKAITGGVLALKGQLVKVKGHLVAAKGKLLETKGDAITEFGKHLATKALLTPVHLSNYDHSGPAPAQSYGPPPGHYPAAAPPSSYGPPPPPAPAHSYLPPSSFGNDYVGQYQNFPPTLFGHQMNFPPDYNQHLKRDTIDSKKGLGDGVQAGLIILKPMQKHALHAASSQQENVYSPPQAFSKSSDGDLRRRRLDFDPMNPFEYLY